jgi:hypothetical protein
MQEAAPTAAYHSSWCLVLLLQSLLLWLPLQQSTVSSGSTPIHSASSPLNAMVAACAELPWVPRPAYVCCNHINALLDLGSSFAIQG